MSLPKSFKILSTVDVVWAEKNHENQIRLFAFKSFISHSFGFKFNEEKDNKEIVCILFFWSLLKLRNWGLEFMSVDYDFTYFGNLW